MTALKRLLLLAALSGGLASGTRAQDTGGFDLSAIPSGFLDFSDLVMVTSPDGGMTVSATTTLGNAQALVMYTSLRGVTGTSGRVLALKPDNWSLTEQVPALANPVLDGLTLSYVTLVLSEVDARLPSSWLSDEQLAFFSEVYGSEDFTLVLHPGINLIAAIPAEGLPPDHPLLGVMDALGIERGTILLQGSLGRSLALLRGGVSAAALRDVYLRAELPPMRPPGSPEWFRSGQLALEITGQPSVRLVGEMNVTIDEAELEFFLAAMLARTGVSLAGGMQAARPWVSPFGVEWLTLNRVVLAIGITSTGSVSLGFAGAAVIGEKDIDVAVSLAISPAGVPTNFMMRGASEAGVALSDLATVQAAMAAARDRAAGAIGAGSAPPLIPLDALPPVEIRSMELQFAPRPDPVLGIERGFKVRGRLWLPFGPGGELTDFAGVDAGLTDEGLWIRGDLGAFRVGPLTWDDAVLDLTATRAEQHLIVRGQMQLGASRQLVDLSITRDALSFRSETELFGLFHATITAQGAFELRNPTFQVHGVVHNDFGQFVQPIMRDGIIRFASTGRAVIAGARTAADAANRALAVQQATAAQLRAVLVSQRANAEAAWRSNESRAATALASANAARRARDAAHSLWAGTPLRQPALRAARRAEHLRLSALYTTRLTAYTALRAAADARRAVLDAIPLVDRNILLLGAEAAVSELRRLLAQVEADLTTLANRYEAVIAAVDAGADPLAIEYAEFQASLAVVQGGGAMSFLVRGTFVGQPFEMRRQLDFRSPAQAVAELLTGLVGR